MTNILTWNIKPIVLSKSSSNLLSVVSLILLLTMAYLPVSEAHPSKVKHVKYYDVTLCGWSGQVLSKTYLSTSYYILEAHEEDPLHSSGSCSINHDVKLIISEVWYVTYDWSPCECPLIC